MNLLYITDVFCPWCYGFLPVMKRLAAEYPSLPVKVLGGNLMDTPQRISAMLEEHPALVDFFLRLEQTTGQTTARFRELLQHVTPQGSTDWLMHSAPVNLPLAVLRQLAPGKELEQMEVFENHFYGSAGDVMQPEFWIDTAARWGIDAETFQAALQQEETRLAADHDAHRAEEIMGEFCLYPTLYLERDNQLFLVTRGYAPYETAHTALEGLFEGAATPMIAAGAACGLDGHCSA